MITDKRHRLDLLLGAEFVLALVVLALNDHVLKPAFPGWVTGKLSDFAGLFAFAVFLIALWPRRPWFIVGLVATAFAFWKSALSDGLLAAWNYVAPLQLARVVDPTDLIALCVLPLAVIYAMRTPAWRLPRHARPVMVLASVFLFAATSAAPETRRDGATYDVPVSRSEVLRRIALADSADAMLWLGMLRPGEGADTLPVRVRGVEYMIEVRDVSPDAVRITVLEITADEGRWEEDVARTRGYFVSAVIARLQRP